jgi:hypothetical protein
LAEPGKQEPKFKKQEKKSLKSGKTKKKTRTSDGKKPERSIEIETTLDLVCEKEEEDAMNGPDAAYDESRGILCVQFDDRDVKDYVENATIKKTDGTLLKNRTVADSEIAVDIGDRVFDEASEAGTKITDVSSQSDSSQSDSEERLNNTVDIGFIVENKASEAESKNADDISQSDSKGSTEVSSQDDHDVHQAETLRLHRLLSEALAKVVKVTEERMLEKNNVIKVSTEFAELKAEYSKASHQRCQLLANLEERDESLKVSERRITALKTEVESQVDLRGSLHIKLESANDEIYKLDTEIVSLEDEVYALQENYAGYEELQQELVKEKEKAAQRELSTQAFKKEDESGGVGALKETLNCQEFETSAMLSEKDDVIATLQKELAQLRNIVIAREYNAEAAGNQLDASSPVLSDEMTQADENTKVLAQGKGWDLGGVFRSAKKLDDEEAEAAGKQLDAGGPVLTDDVTQADENTKELAQKKGWGLGGVFRSAKNIDDEEAEAAGDQLDAGSPVLTDDETQADENPKALPQGKGWGLGGVFRSAKNVDDEEEAEASGDQLDAGSPVLTDGVTQADKNTKALPQGKGWGLGGMFRSAKNLGIEEAETSGDQLDAGSPVLTDDVTQAVENMKAERMGPWRNVQEHEQSRR